MIPKTLPNPYGCEDCGADQSSHGVRYTKSAGSHRWIKPSDWKILLRMQARRIGRKGGL